jgi:hypothetical protein
MQFTVIQGVVSQIMIDTFGSEMPVQTFMNPE